LLVLRYPFTANDRKVDLYRENAVGVINASPEFRETVSGKFIPGELTQNPTFQARCRIASDLG
jgi:hypothetical protein